MSKGEMYDNLKMNLIVLCFSLRNYIHNKKMSHQPTRTQNESRDTQFQSRGNDQSQSRGDGKDNPQWKNIVDSRDRTIVDLRAQLMNAERKNMDNDRNAANYAADRGGHRRF